jgi:hypothetical protein
MTINKVVVENNECIAPLLSFGFPTFYGFSFTKMSVMKSIINNDYIKSKLKNGTLYMELLHEPMYAKDISFNRYCEVWRNSDMMIRIKDFYCYKGGLEGAIEIEYTSPLILKQYQTSDFETEIRFVFPNVKESKNGFIYADSFNFITFDLMPTRWRSNPTLEAIVRRKEEDKAKDKWWYLFGANKIKLGDEPVKLRQENVDFARLDDKHYEILHNLLEKSRLPTRDCSIEITALEKAEEELIELLAEIRKLKNCFSPVKSERKGYTEDTKIAVTDNVIKEIGDVIVDVVYGLSTIIPLINVDLINKAVENKFEKYLEVMNKVMKSSDKEIEHYSNHSEVLDETLDNIEKIIEKAKKYNLLARE